jgi:Domain of unknown function (DUF6538)
MGYGRYLRRRGHTWFFRYRWPAALAACSFASELTFTLRTRDYRVAVRRARLLRLQVEELMNRFTPQTPQADAEAMVRGWIDACLWRREARLAETDGIALLEPDDIEKLGRENAAELDGLLLSADRMFAGEQKARIARALGPSARGIDEFADVIAGVGNVLDVPVDRNTPDGRLWSRTILRGYATLLDELRQTIAAIPRQVAAIPPKSTLPEFKFLAYWEEFSAAKIRNKEWKSDTARNAEGTRKLFQSLMDDLQVAEINGGVADNFRQKFLQLPRDYHSKTEWKSLAPAKILKEIAELSEVDQKKIDRTSTVTANKHISNCIEYWDYLVRTEKIPKAENPFRGHISAKPRGRAAREEHPVWPADLERRLFMSPLFAGCKSMYRRADAGDEIHRDALFWVTLMGRSMGLREDEACDRKVGDIDFVETEAGPLPYIKIRDSKTTSSTRDVPLPARLLDLGFLEYRYYGRDPGDPLFPELIPQGPELRRSPGYSGRFVYYRQQIKVYDRLFDFRSFRGNVATQLQNLPDVNPGWVDEILGHESPLRRSEGARYNKGIFLHLLRGVLDRIAIGVDPYNPSKTPPVDFSHLTYAGPRGVPAPGAAEEIAEYVRLAQREMRKKAPRPKA